MTSTEVASYGVTHMGVTSANDHRHTREFIPEDIYVNTWTRKLVEICIDLTLCFVINFVGVITNILIIIIFIKQKFKDSVAVSMTAIALWDLIKCLGCVLNRLAGPMSLWDQAVAESWTNISVLVFVYTTTFATYVSIVLAAYVAIERCLCVSIPFKVKWLITPQSSFIICLAISVVVFGWFSVIYGVYDIIWVYSFHYNKTIAVYVNNEFFYNHHVEVFLFYNLSGIIFPVVCFVIIVASTFVIIYHLRKSSSFRAGESLSQQSQKQAENHISVRERQVVKMLLVIIIIYVVCVTPRIAHYIVKYFVYEFYFLRRYHNLFMIMAFVVFTFDSLNSAINLFVFLPMSSSFRATFHEVFPRVCKWAQIIRQTL